MIQASGKLAKIDNQDPIVDAADKIGAWIFKLLKSKIKNSNFIGIPDIRYTGTPYTRYPEYKLAGTGR